MNFSQQYRKNRQRCRQNKFYYAVWQLLLYFIEKFAQEFSPCTEGSIQVYRKITDLFVWLFAQPDSRKSGFERV